MASSAAVGSLLATQNPASAHLSYVIDRDEIVMNPDTYPVRWSALTFIDNALATAETALALDLAVACGTCSASSVL
jgi:hypothetical protein